MNRSGRLEAVPGLLREAQALRPGHAPLLGARAPLPATFPPLLERGRCCLQHPLLSEWGAGDGPCVLGSSGAGRPPLSLRAPAKVVGRVGREPTRKVQLAVWAEDRAVTKAVLRVGESREEEEGGARMRPPRAPANRARHPAQGHVATASR